MKVLKSTLVACSRIGRAEGETNVIPNGGRGGFSRTEALVVVLVVLTLVALLMPAFHHYPDGGARRASCSHNLDQIGNAFTMYIADHYQWPYGCRRSDSTGTAARCFAALRTTYVRDASLFECPANPSKPVWDGTKFTSGLGYGYNPKNSTGYIARTADPLRAAAADRDTVNHMDGSVVLFVDKHVRYVHVKNKLPGIIQNPHLNADTNIYAYDPGVSNNVDAHIVCTY
jgi:type II secretory pathway pseudopilin PulG